MALNRKRDAAVYSQKLLIDHLLKEGKIDFEWADKTILDSTVPFDSTFRPNALGMSTLVSSHG